MLPPPHSVPPSSLFSCRAGQWREVWPRRVLPVLLAALAWVGGMSGEVAAAAAGFGASASRELPVRDGLWLLLDASAQRAAREQAGLPGLSPGSPVDRWLDTSAGGRVAWQGQPSARPVYRTDGAEALVRFDGKDDALVLSGLRHRVRAMTLFVLAAPRGNPGTFSGMFGSAVAGQNDYTTGLNLDFGPNATPRFSVLNVESAGSPGFRNLLSDPGPGVPARAFGRFHVFTVRSTSAEEGNEVFLDGELVGARRRLPSDLGLDDVVIGGRVYSNDGGEPPFVQGSFQGDVAVVAVYERRLSDDERRAVEERLLARVAALDALAGGVQGHALEVLKDAPVVQMFVPGFAVDELPVQMRNLTGLRYRHDGRLVALGYDGRIHLLSDTDGDGREDRAVLFWDRPTLRGPIGMALLPAGDPRGDGVLVASKGKVSLILDRDRNGAADEEIIVASGWQEISQSVDAVGLAVDPRDGSIYFGLGTANYANGYLIDPGTGRSAFNLWSERGTIQRVSADFRTRETVCTGVRFTCALAFNRHGDLFASEQEGATWLPNGNPFDELLHIERGRHYGFPPRHPRHLPGVIDEPAVFEYGPQHQSTVGMIFNEGVNGGPVWGPPDWAGDALLCGESRGKLYRTRLVKTPAGYVAQNHLIGGLGMLLVDACVTPRGDLLLACHSGPPDWGTGPAGAGRVFRVRWTGRDTPQPVWAWASAPDEFRIAFDRPLRDADWAGAREKVRIEAGRFVSAGDRFEVMRPGYQVVRDQMAAPRRWVSVSGLSLSQDRRTLVLRVPRQTEPVGYAITLPTPESWRVPGAMAQKPEMDLAVSLDGVVASLETSTGQVASVIWPHPSLAVARGMTRGSTAHAAFFAALEGAGTNGTLRLRGAVDRSNVFVPAVQPGATLDWDVTKDAFARERMVVRQEGLPAAETAPGSGPEVPVSGEHAVGGYEAVWRGAWDRRSNSSAGLVLRLGDRVRPVPLARWALPWSDRATGVPVGRDVAAASSTAIAPAAGSPLPPLRTDVRGRWLEGRRVFFGDGGCATCHVVRGEGMEFGPDLTNLTFRDRASVLHDILQPSATINPEVTGSTVKFRDGTEVSGVVATLDAERVVVRQPAGVRTERPRADVVSVTPMSGSLMPENLAQVLTAEQLEDLLTFLLSNPLEPTRITRVEPAMPPARSRRELEGLVPSPAAPRGAAQAPLRILLCVDDKDHGLDEHDYPLWQERWARLLSLAEGVTVTTARVFPTRAQLAAADVMVFYSRNSGWGRDKAALLDEFQARGGGVVLIHWAMEGRQEALAYAERVGLATGPGSRYRHGAMELNFVRRDHPITRGFTRLPLVDETYWAFHGEAGRVTVLADAVEEAAPRIQLWTREQGRARVFGSIPGHYMWTFDDPLYRVLLLRGIAWAAHQADVDRLLDLSTVGARIAP